MIRQRRRGTTLGRLQRSALLASGFALTALAPCEAFADEEILKLVGPARYEIPVRAAQPGDVEVRIPIDLTDPAALPQQLTVVRVISPSEGDASRGFSFDYASEPAPALLARVSPVAAQRSGNYLVSLRARTDGGVGQTLELTFVRAAPVIDVGPIVLDCIENADDCGLSRQRVTLTESSGLAGASNIRFVFKAPLRNPDAGEVAAVEIAPVASLDAGKQAFAEIRGGERLPLGVTTGVVLVRSDEGVEISAQVEIRRRRSKWWLFVLLALGIMVASLRRGLIARTIARNAALASARSVIERLEWRTANHRDDSLRRAVRSALDVARKQVAAASTAEQLAEIAEGAEAAVEKLVGENEAARARRAQEARRLIDALAPATDVPKTLAAPLEALRTRLVTHLAELDGMALVEAEAQAEAIRRDLVTAAGAASQWVAGMAQLDLGGWQLPSLKRFNEAVLPKIEQFDPTVAPETVLAGAAEIAALVRHLLLSALPRQIAQLAATVRDELARPSPDAAVRSELQKADQALADLRCMLDGDADDAPAVAIASRAVHTTLVSVMRAATPADDWERVDAALKQSDFTGALELLATARAKALADVSSKARLGALPVRSSLVLEANSDAPSSKAVDMATPALRRPTKVRTAAASPAETPAPQTLRSMLRAPFGDGRWANVVEHLLASLGLAGGAFLTLEPAFVGTPRDFLVTVLCSLGVELGASTLAPAWRGAVQPPKRGTDPAAG